MQRERREVYMSLSVSDFDLKIDVTPQLYSYFNLTYQDIRDKLKWTTNDQSVKNPTYDKQVPNIPRFYFISNWRYIWYFYKYTFYSRTIFSRCCNCIYSEHTYELFRKKISKAKKTA